MRHIILFEAKTKSGGNASKDPKPSEVVEWNEQERPTLDRLEYTLKDAGVDYDQYILFKNADRPGVRCDWDGVSLSSVIFTYGVWYDQGKGLVGIRCTKLTGNRWHLSFGSVCVDEERDDGLFPAIVIYEHELYLSRVGFVCDGFGDLADTIRWKFRANKIPIHPSNDRSRVAGSKQLQRQIRPEYERLNRPDPSGLYRPVNTTRLSKFSNWEDIGPRETERILAHFKDLGLALKKSKDSDGTSEVFTLDLKTWDKIVVTVYKNDDDEWFVSFQAVPAYHSNESFQCRYKCEGMPGLFKVFSGPMKEFIEICVEKSNQIAQASKKPGR